MTKTGAPYLSWKVSRGNQRLVPENWSWDSWKDREQWTGCILQFCRKGEIVAQVGKNPPFRYGAGGVMCTNPDTERTVLKHGGKGPLESMWVELLPLEISRCGLSGCYEMKDLPFAQTLFRRGISRILANPRDLAGAERYFAAFLLELSHNSHVLPNSRPSTDRAERAVRKAAQKLTAEPERSWNLREMAEESEMSYASFFAHFHSLYGCGPQEFLAIRRVETAKIHLASLDLTISEIAYALGYCNPFAFTKIFKRHAGFSPRIYRERIKGEHPRDRQNL